MERLPAESPQAYEAYRLYVEMGPERAMERVAQKLGKSLVLMKRWSSKHHWVARATAHDQRLIELEIQAEEAKLVQKAGLWAKRMQETREQAFQMAERLLEKAEAMLKFPLAETTTADGQTTIKPARWSYADAARLIDTAARLKQLATGLPTERLEHAGPQGQPLPAAGPQVIFYLPANHRSDPDAAA